jgi:hypothetical protein
VVRDETAWGFPHYVGQAVVFPRGLPRWMVGPAHVCAMSHATMLRCSVCGYFWQYGRGGHGTQQVGLYILIAMRFAPSLTSRTVRLLALRVSSRTYSGVFHCVVDRGGGW